MHVHSTLDSAPRQSPFRSPPSRPPHHRDDRERQAIAVYDDLLVARRRGRWNQVRHLQSDLFDLGYAAEPFESGFRMVRVSTARKGVA